VAQPLPVYVVHSRPLSVRRHALERALAALDWTATWIDAPEAGVLSYVARRVSPRLSRAQASVYLKQLACWKRVAAAGDARALVLEDDPIFPPGFAQTFEAYLESLPEDAGAAFFGASCGLEADAMPSNPRFASVNRTRSMSTYVVTPEWCRQVLADLDGGPLALPIDLAVDAVIRRHGLTTYWSVPALVCNGSESGAFPRSVTKGAWRIRLRSLMPR
jgi:hypothetical protein